MITPKQIAQRLGLDPCYVRRTLIPQMERLVIKKRVLVAEEDFAAWMDAHTKRPDIAPHSKLRKNVNIKVADGLNGPIYVTAKTAEEAEEMAAYYRSKHT